MFTIITVHCVLCLDKIMFFSLHTMLEYINRDNFSYFYHACIEINILSLFFSEWFRGFAVKNKTRKGIFPRNYIALKEASVHVSGYVCK